MSRSASTAKPARRSRAMLTVEAQHAILSQCQWTADGRLLVLCTHRTRPLLRLAGVRSPRALSRYAVRVRYVWPGLLTVARTGR